MATSGGLATQAGGRQERLGRCRRPGRCTWVLAARLHAMDGMLQGVCPAPSKAGASFQANELAPCMGRPPSEAHCTPVCSAALLAANQQQVAGSGRRVVESPSRHGPSAQQPGGAALLQLLRSDTKQQAAGPRCACCLRADGCRCRRRCRRQPPRIATDRGYRPCLV